MSETCHFTIEDFDKYVTEDYSQEYLQWYEERQDHMNTCELCQKKLQKFMLVDAIVSDFNTSDYIKISKKMKHQEMIERVKALALRLADVSFDNILDGLQRGLSYAFSFTNASYPALCTVRGEEGVTAEYWIDWGEREVTVNLKAQKENCSYVIDLEKNDHGTVTSETRLVKAKCKGEQVSASFVAGSQGTQYAVQVFEIDNQEK